MIRIKLSIIRTCIIMDFERDDVVDVKKIGVIGCGPAGLFALQQLSHNKLNYLPVGYEKCEDIGGVWNYRDEMQTTSFGQDTNSSMYKDMITYPPKEVIAVQDFSFPDHLPSHIRQRDVHSYLKSYSENFDLNKYIKTKVIVKRVVPNHEDKNRPKWIVNYIHQDAPDIMKTDILDGLLICTGHNTVPKIPEISGMKDFKGKIIHSQAYHTADEFRGKCVIVVGTGVSGLEITIQISKQATNVYLCSNKREDIPCILPNNVTKKGDISCIIPCGASLQNGQMIYADAIVVCTGYSYKFPFLSDGIIKINNERITPLYKHIVHTSYTNLFFIGIPKDWAYFKQMNDQIKFALFILNDERKLPSKLEMEADIEYDFQKRLEDGLRRDQAHLMNSRQWQYNEEIARIAGFDPIPKVIQSLYEFSTKQLRFDYSSSRKTNYKIVSPDKFITIS